MGVKPTFEDVVKTSHIPEELKEKFLKQDLGFAKTEYNKGTISEGQLKQELQKAVPLRYYLRRSMRQALD